MVSESRTEVAVQFTGGKDSTYLALLSAEEFERVHLLTFRHSLIADIDKASVNVTKLGRRFGTRKFRHVMIDVEDSLRKIYQQHFLKDLSRYGTYGASNFCGARRLAMISHTIIYCLRNHVKHVRDGSNASGFDLSQQEWSLPLIRQFYNEFGLNYETPLYRNKRNDIELLKSGLSDAEPAILFRSQPRCEGGGHFHNIYLRCYFLPLYGREALKKVGTRWIKHKLVVLREQIRDATGMPDVLT